MTEENEKKAEKANSLYGANTNETNWLATAGTQTNLEAEIAAARLSVRRLLEAGKDASAAALRVARLVQMQNDVKNQQAADLFDAELDD